MSAPMTTEQMAAESEAESRHAARGLWVALLVTLAIALAAGAVFMFLASKAG